LVKSCRHEFSASVTTEIRITEIEKAISAELRYDGIRDHSRNNRVERRLFELSELEDRIISPEETKIRV
jgi:hypothetical protein